MSDASANDASASDTSANGQADTAARAEVTAAVREGLGTVTVTAGRSLAELGGTSLTAARIAASLRTRTGKEVSALDVLDAPSVGELARQVAARPRAGAGPPGEGRMTGPLSPAQVAIWLHEQAQPDHLRYVEAVRFDLPPAISPRRLRDAVSAAARVHPVCGAHVEPTITTPRWHLGTAEPEVRLVDTVRASVPDAAGDEDATDEAAREEELAIAEFIARPFALAAGPLMRALIIRGSAGHSLILCWHHLAADGWSARLFCEEVAAFYADPGREPRRESRTLCDLAIEQHGRQSGADVAGRVDEVIAGLTGAPLQVDWPVPSGPVPSGGLPGGRLPGEQSPAEAGWLPVALPPELVEQVQREGRRRGVTPHVLLLAAFRRCIEQAFGFPDPIIGCAFAGRDQAGADRVMGSMVNTLLLRVPDADGDVVGDGDGDTVGDGDVVGATDSAVRRALRFADVPFSLVAGKLLRRASPRPAVFPQVYFSFDDAIELKLGEVSGVRRHLPGLSPKFDLTLELEQSGTQVAGRCGFRTSAVPEDSARLLVDSLPKVLRSLCEPLNGPRLQPDPRLEEEAADLVPYEILRQPPDRYAIRSGGSACTYGELIERSLTAAAALRSRGVGPDRIVAVCLPPSTEMIVAQLAVWLAGGAFLPLDPGHPAERLRFIVEDAEAHCVITRPDMAGEFCQGRSSVSPEQLEQLPGAGGAAGPPASRALPEHLTLPEHLAYVIYTSGSTGRPKGVAVQHGSLRTLTASWRAEMGIQHTDRGSQIASVGFDASFLEIWPVLISGGTLHIAHGEARTDPYRVCEFLRANRITVTFLPTPLAEAVLALDLSEGLPLRVCGTGGDQLRTVPSARHGFRLVNAYGPTESTVVATAGTVHPGRATLPPIGRAIAGVEIRVLDENKAPVPDGTTGEIYLGGDNLARGYLHRPDLTADRFEPDPDPLRPGRRLYRTGDLGRRRPDGVVDFAGRCDDQVKVRGHRIELGEVEATLLRHPAIRSAAVKLTRSPASGESMLAAYVVPEADEPEIAALRGYAGQHLVPAMVPTAWTFLPELPLSPNGKIARADLPDPEIRVSAADEPQGAVEKLLAGLWHEVLGERVGRDDNFFEAGGHSLLATQVAARIRQVLDLPDLPLSAVFEAPTLRELAAYLEAYEGYPGQVREYALVEGLLPATQEAP